MTDAVRQRADSIRQILREHPERGADLLLDFARRHAADTQCEDEIILLKLQLQETDAPAEKQALVKQLDVWTQSIADNYNADKQTAFTETENALAAAAQQMTEPERTSGKRLFLQAGAGEDVVLQARNMAKHFASSSFTLQVDSLDLRLGQITGLVGENATGKTTLFRILAGELAPSSGELYYPLFDVRRRQSWLQRRQQIAYVSQELPAWHGALRDNLHYEAALHRLRGEANRKAVDFIVQRLGLGLHLDKRWNELSGGFKLRFSLARALVWNPRLLLLDEPLAFLDIKTQLVVLNDLQHLAKSLRRPIAVLLSSQHLHEIEAVADQMLFMRGGRLENLGYTDALGEDRQQNVYELGCDLSYARFQAALEHFEYNKLWYNGLYWIVTTPRHISGQLLLWHLASQGVEVSYYRDLSRSVKIKFYEKEL